MKFLPDAPRDTPEVLTEVEAVPTVRGYAGSPTVINGGYAALAAACNGAALIFKLDGSMRIFAGTQSKLYEGSGGTWTDRSRAGSYTTGDIRWCFAQFGDTTLAINKATVLQSSTSGAFADVANAPKAACMETVGGFVVLGNTDDTGLAITGGPNADQGNRWWCSQLFNATGTWAPSAATQATSGLLVSSPGKIIAMKRLGDQVIAYKNRAIHVGQYVGPPDVFDWQLVPGEIGTWSNESVVSTGTAHLFVGYENIYRFDGSRPVEIGTGIREWFFARLNKSYAHLIAGIHDRNTSTVWWWYPSGSNTTLDSVLIYNYAADRWGHITDGIGLEPIPTPAPPGDDESGGAVEYNTTNEVGTWTFTDSDTTAEFVYSGVGTASVVTTNAYSTGKRYIEFLWQDVGSYGSGVRDDVGITQSNPPTGGASVADGAAYRRSGNIYDNNSSTASVTAVSAGDVIGVAVDFDNAKVWFSLNGSWVSGDPSAGTSPSISTLSAGSYYAGNTMESGGVQKVTIRTLTADFTGTKPTGFKSWAAV